MGSDVQPACFIGDSNHHYVLFYLFKDELSLILFFDSFTHMYDVFGFLSSHPLFSLLNPCQDPSSLF